MARPLLSPRECNCDGRVRKRGGEKALHFSITKSDQSDSTGRNADSWISSTCCGSLCKQAILHYFFGFQDVDCVIEE